LDLFANTEEHSRHEWFSLGISEDDFSGFSLFTREDWSWLVSVGGVISIGLETAGAFDSSSV
jgi:hypothetical protein